jgi:hypothetical protein
MTEGSNMERNQPPENEDIVTRLEQANERMLRAANVSLTARPGCPPLPRLKRGMLRPHEEIHKEECPFCSQVGKRQSGFQRPVLRYLAIAAGVLLLLILIHRLWPHNGVYPQSEPILALHADTKRDLALFDNVGEQRMAALARPRYQLDMLTGLGIKPALDEQRLALAKTVGASALAKLEALKLSTAETVDGPTLESLGAMEGQLASVVSPKTLLVLERMDQRIAPSLSAAELQQFSEIQLKTAQIASTRQLLKTERLKAALLAKLPAAVVLELARANLDTAKVCGPRVLDALWTHEAASAGRVAPAVLLEKAHYYRELAVRGKISRRRLETIAAYDYQEVLMRKSSLPTGGASLAPAKFN